MPENIDISEKTLLEWESYERPHKVWTKEFYSSVIVIAFLVSVILFFIEGVMPIFVVWALVFMMWAMSKTEPLISKNTLTTWGVRSTTKLYEFGRMNNFWFENRWGSRLLRINLVDSPWHVVFVVKPEIEEKLKGELSKVVQHMEPEITVMDRMVKWLAEKIPLE